MAALVGAMSMVSIGTFDWSSLTKLHVMPKTDAAVMIVTVLTVVLTHDLSKGVMAGVILSALFFASKISKVYVETRTDEVLSTKTYIVKGQLFFASVTDFVSKFDITEKTDKIVIDFSQTHIWDDSAVGAIDKIVIKYRLNGTDVEIVGLNEESAALVSKLAVHDKAETNLPAH
jgi:SulP family sulfate permease